MKLTKNELETLRFLYAREKATKRDIAKETQLSSFVVTSTIELLEQKNLIRSGEEERARRGRPSNFYKINPDFGYFVGLSADLTEINLVLLDSLNSQVNEECASFRVETGNRERKNFKLFLKRVLEELDKFIERCNTKKEKIKSLGIAVPGIIDSERGIWLRGLRIPGVEGINLREIIQAKYKVPVLIEDVARTLTYYEKNIGNGKNSKNFFLLHLGYGVGGGVVVNGSIVKGYNGFAGEIGHIIVEPSGYRCHCGNIGCLETVASVDGILHRLNHKMNELVVSSMHSHAFHKQRFNSLEEVLNAAKQGDSFTQSVLGEIGSLIGDACSNVLLLFNPDRIIVSGPCSLLSDYIKDSMFQRLRERVLPEILSGFELIFARYTQDQEAYGAALLARDLYWQEQIFKNSKY